MKGVVAAAIDDIIKALTDPLTEEESAQLEIEYDYSNKIFTGANYSEADEKFQEYCSVITSPTPGPYAADKGSC
jgi:hypothetical protein